MMDKHNQTLTQIHEFILKAGELGYGEVVLTIKAHDYRARIVDMKAEGPGKKTIAKSITKRVMIDGKKIK